MLLALGNTLLRQRTFWPFWSSGHIRYFSFTDLRLVNSQCSVDSSIYICTLMYNWIIPRFALKSLRIKKSWLAHYKVGLKSTLIYRSAISHIKYSCMYRHNNAVSRITRRNSALIDFKAHHTALWYIIAGTWSLNTPFFLSLSGILLWCLFSNWMILQWIIKKCR